MWFPHLGRTRKGEFPWAGFVSAVTVGVVSIMLNYGRGWTAVKRE